MKKTRTYSNQEIRMGTEEERREQQAYIDKYNEKLHRKWERNAAIGHSIKYVIFTPVIIALNIVTMIFKLVGGIASIGLPYGLYCVYKTIVQMNAGMALADIKQTTFVCLFVILPFTAFAIAMLSEKLADFLELHK